MLFDGGIEALGMLDHLPLHIDDPECPIRAVGKLHRPKPDVARGDEFRLGIDPFRPHAGAVRHEPLAVDDVGPHVTHDEHPGQVADGIAAHKRDPRGAREVAGGPAPRLVAPFDDARRPQPRSQHPPRLDRAHAEDGRLRPFDRDALLGRRRREERVSRHEAVVDHAADGVIAVVADIDMAHVVGRTAVLGAAGLRAEVERFGIERKIAAAHRHRGPFGLALVVHAADRACPGTCRAVDAVVDVVGERVEEALHIPGAKPGEDLSPLVGHAVAVPVLHIEDVWRIADEDAAPPGHHRRRPGEVGGEDRGPIVSAVAVVVMEQADPTEPLPLVLAVAPHLGDEEAAVLVPRDRHGACEQRLRDGKVEGEAGANPHRGRCVGRTGLRDAGQIARVVGLAGRLIGGANVRCHYDRHHDGNAADTGDTHKASQYHADSHGSASSRNHHHYSRDRNVPHGKSCKHSCRKRHGRWSLRAIALRRCNPCSPPPVHCP